MAAAPPPYNPRDYKQQWKSWARAQKDAARSQRFYWRYYHRPSIAGPVILLAVGIIALLMETGRLSAPRFWGWYAQWWPMLLIGIGLVLLLEYFIDRNNPYAGRRSMGGFGILILLLILGGLGTHAAHVWGPLHDQFSDNGDDFWSLMGEEHDNDVQQDEAISPNAAVQIQNPRGDVTITASSDDKMHLKAHQVVHTSSDNDARKTFDAVTPKVINSGANVTLTVEGRNNARVDLTVELPPTANTVVNAGRGDVTIEGLKTNSDVNASHGDVKFDSMGGNVHARMDHGDFSAHQITGDVAVDGHVGDVTLSDVKGNVTLDGEFFGDTHLEQVGSAVHFHSSRTDLAIQKLQGDMTMDSSDLNITQPVGPLRVVTRSKDMDISQLTGDAHIENNNGDVNITTAAPLGNLQVSTRTGDLSITVPENAGFSVTASNADGDLRTDFPLTMTNSDDRKSAQGQIGTGGPHLELSTGHGDLQLRKGGPGSMVAPPSPPPAPPAGAKHLHAPKGPNPPPAPTEQ
ncbi:DUF4097 family beta strand repeat-containing protein [Alloacidobacterium sp.]|uniref:DUF4097 family beta strand repeat-containing protein n=1 Tax=Alloacidobacterium sp. TaxID=2951999 RepID=UPI002D552384|nr:DUF4097 family beta strand repeat-containing protein [Alloacidobacterium sp.]HYK34842.1 DUF4097 family beta strand repeat-containing protein [Alloacidobacterium sp.]